MNPTEQRRLIFRTQPGPNAMRVAALAPTLIIAGVAYFYFCPNPRGPSPLWGVLVFAGLGLVPLIWFLYRRTVLIDIDEGKVLECHGLLPTRPHRQEPLERFKEVTLTSPPFEQKYLLSLSDDAGGTLVLLERAHQAPLWPKMVRTAALLHIPMVDRSETPAVVIAPPEDPGPLRRHPPKDATRALPSIVHPAQQPEGAAVEWSSQNGLRLVLRPPGPPAGRWSKVNLAAVTAVVLLMWLALLGSEPHRSFSLLIFRRLFYLILIAVGFAWTAALTRSRPLTITVDERRVRVSRRPVRTLLLPESIPTAEVLGVFPKAGGGLAIVSPKRAILLDGATLRKRFGLSARQVRWLEATLTAAVVYAGSSATGGSG